MHWIPVKMATSKITNPIDYMHAFYHINCIEHYSWCQYTWVTWSYHAQHLHTYDLLSFVLPCKAFMCPTASLRIVSLSGLRASVLHAGTISHNSFTYVAILQRLRLSISQWLSLEKHTHRQSHTFDKSNTTMDSHTHIISILNCFSTCKQLTASSCQTLSWRDLFLYVPRFTFEPCAAGRIQFVYICTTHCYINFHLTIDILNNNTMHAGIICITEIRK